jgi:hypothetical protein
MVIQSQRRQGQSPVMFIRRDGLSSETLAGSASGHRLCSDEVQKIAKLDAARRF